MDFKKFINDVLGKAIDTDGFPKGQPYQCVDLIKYFNSLYNPGLDIRCNSSGYAKDWAINKETNGLLNYFKETSVDNMIEGTLVVYGECRQAPLSHICFFLSDNKDGTFKALGQNQNKHYVTITNLRYEGIIGAFIPKQLIKENISNNYDDDDDIIYITLGDMYIRRNAGTQYSIKLVEEITEDGRKNATSDNPKAFAVYKKGTKFTVRRFINVGKAVWAETPSGYICIEGGSGTVYCKNVS